jgi:hypothetical protein
MLLSSDCKAKISGKIVMKESKAKAKPLQGITFAFAGFLPFY